MAEAVPIIVGALMAGSAVYSGVKQSEAAEEARKQSDALAKQQQDQQNQLLKQQEDERKKYEADQAKLESEQAQLDRNSMRERQRARARGAMGRRDTFLTGPLGVVGEVEGAQKTLLGA